MMGSEPILTEEARLVEIRQTLGFMKLPDGPIQLDYNDLMLVDNNFGVDVLFQKPIIARHSEDLQHYRNYIKKPDISSSEMALTHAMCFTTSIVVRYLEHHRIPGEIILHYETIRQHMNMKVICRAYESC